MPVKVLIAVGQMVKQQVLSAAEAKGAVDGDRPIADLQWIATRFDYYEWDELTWSVISIGSIILKPPPNSCACGSRAEFEPPRDRRSRDGGKTDCDIEDPRRRTLL
jgi:hypothetical protein